MCLDPSPNFRCEDLESISVGLHLNSRHLLFLGFAAILGGEIFMETDIEVVKKQHQKHGVLDKIGWNWRFSEVKSWRLRCLFLVHVKVATGCCSLAALCCCCILEKTGLRKFVKVFDDSKESHYNDPNDLYKQKWQEIEITWIILSHSFWVDSFSCHFDSMFFLSSLLIIPIILVSEGRSIVGMVQKWNVDCELEHHLMRGPFEWYFSWDNWRPDLGWQQMRSKKEHQLFLKAGSSKLGRNLDACTSTCNHRLNQEKHPLTKQTNFRGRKKIGSPNAAQRNSRPLVFCWLDH